MRMLRLSFLLPLLWMATPAWADDAMVVTTCGSPSQTYVAGVQRPITQDTTGKGCVAISGTVTTNQGTAGPVTGGWPVIGGELQPDTTGTFTNATQTTSITGAGLDGYGTALVTINGTYGTATGVFELSDDGGATWYGVQASRTNACTVESGYTSLTNTNQAWIVPVSGADSFRVRSTAVASGTVNVRISISSSVPPNAASICGSVTTTQSSQYPSGAVAETTSATGTTGATTATLATASTKTTFICGFSIRANATAAATGNATVTGTITGTLNFTQWTAPTASGLGVTEMIFTPCVPASAVNTAIAVISAAPGSGGVVSVSAWGFQQ